MKIHEWPVLADENIGPRVVDARATPPSVSLSSRLRYSAKLPSSCSISIEGRGTPPQGAERKLPSP